MTNDFNEENLTRRLDFGMSTDDFNSWIKRMDFKEAIQMGINRLDEKYRGGSTVSGLETGFSDLDFFCDGLQNGSLTILAGRPSMGKTAFALSIVNHIAVSNNKSVLWFSPLMIRDQLIQRILASRAGVDMHQIRSAFLSPEAWPKITKVGSELENIKLYIDDTAGISFSELEYNRIRGTQYIIR